MSLRFTSLLKDLIVESSRFQVLFDKFVKPKDKGQKGVMPFETLIALIDADHKIWTELRSENTLSGY
jgi:hypothetical protein